MGTGDIALPVFERLAGNGFVVALVTQPDRPVGRSSKPRAPRIKQEAEDRGIPVLQPENVRCEKEIAAISVFDPELIVVMAYGQILSSSLLCVPPRGCINIHASLLPRHRGASCIQAAIAAGDQKSGISVIEMVEELDAGDVLLKKSVTLLAHETGGSLHDRLAEVAPSVIMECLKKIETQKIKAYSQDASLVTYAPQLQRRDGQIDWRFPADVLERRIRAYEPWPGSYTNFRDGRGRTKRLKVFAGAEVVDRERGAASGEVVSVDSSGIGIACGRGALMLNDLQIEGGKRLPVAELVRGNTIEVGECFFSLAGSA